MNLHQADKFQTWSRSQSLSLAPSHYCLCALRASAPTILKQSPTQARCRRVCDSPSLQMLFLSSPLLPDPLPFKHPPRVSSLGMVYWSSAPAAAGLSITQPQGFNPQQQEQKLLNLKVQLPIKSQDICKGIRGHAALT